MKNYIPLFLAVLLGIAAVIAVSRVLREREVTREATTTVVAASRDIGAGETIDATMIRDKVIPAMARPDEAVPWAKRALILDQTTMRTISAGDYILTSDFETQSKASSLVGAGEWAVALPTSGGIASLLQPGDEVAVVATFTIERQLEQMDVSKAPLVEEKEITTVLFPKVRILHTGGSGPLRTGRVSASQDVIVALPPQQAQLLIATQRKADLQLALRKTNDDSSVNRKELGIVDSGTFTELIDGLEKVQLPAIPGQMGHTNE